MNKIRLIFFALALLPLCTLNAAAENVKKNTARLQAMDKITGRVSVIDVPVNGEKAFGSLSIVIRSCQTRPAEEAPDNFAFADITDKNLQGEEFNIFKGWMISSSPATHAVEHPIYDVWLLKCVDTKVDAKQLLSDEQLSAHDNIARQHEDAEQSKVLPITDAENKSDDISEPIQELPDEESRPQPVLQSEETMMTTEFSYDEDDVEEEEEVETVDSVNNSDNDAANVNTENVNAESESGTPPQEELSLDSLVSEISE